MTHLATDHSGAFGAIGAPENTRQRARSEIRESLVRRLAGTALHQRIVFGFGVVNFLAILVMAWAADAWLRALLIQLPPEQVADARAGVLIGAACLLALLLAGLGVVSSFVLRSVSAPALRLAAMSERVAAGDLVTRVPGTDADDEMGRLSRAIEGMLAELRRLVGAMNDSAGRTAQMATEITAGTEQMTSAATEVAQTSNDLSAQSSDMADAILKAAADAIALRSIAAQLASGAREGVERNMQLRVLARQSRARLDASTAALEQLAAQAQLAVTSGDELAAASEEIRAFLTFVRKMARQSKLLGLNAAMEAARIGEAGQGFATVANEVRKMSDGASAGAERVQQVVDHVLGRVEETRESSRQTLSNVAALRDAAGQVIGAFEEVEQTVGAMDGWAAYIDSAARGSAELIEGISQRIEMLSNGIESFAAAMEEVAATAQEQSASTQEIAAAASALRATARELSESVGVFRLG